MILDKTCSYTDGTVRFLFNTRLNFPRIKVPIFLFSVWQSERESWALGPTTGTGNEKRRTLRKSVSFSVVSEQVFRNPRSEDWNRPVKSQVLTSDDWEFSSLLRRSSRWVSQ